MRRSSVTVHVGEETRARIEERTDPGESVEDWVREAVHRRLDGSGGAGDGADDGGAQAGDGPDADGREGSVDDDGRTDSADEGGGNPADAPGYEFVDDCGI
jgi:hypothetical protein